MVPPGHGFKKPLLFIIISRSTVGRFFSSHKYTSLRQCISEKYAWEKSQKLLTLLAANVNGYSIFFRPAEKDYALKNVYNGADHPYRLGFKFHPGTIKYLKEQKVWNSKYE